MDKWTVFDHGGASNSIGRPQLRLRSGVSVVDDDAAQNKADLAFQQTTGVRPWTMQTNTVSAPEAATRLNLEDLKKLVAEVNRISGVGDYAPGDLSRDAQTTPSDDQARIASLTAEVERLEKQRGERLDWAERRVEEEVQRLRALPAGEHEWDLCSDRCKLCGMTREEHQDWKIPCDRGAGIIDKVREFTCEIATLRNERDDYKRRWQTAMGNTTTYDDHQLILFAVRHGDAFVDHLHDIGETEAAHQLLAMLKEKGDG